MAGSNQVTGEPVTIERKGKLAFVVLDAPGAATNVIDDRFAASLDMALSTLERATDVSAVVLISGKQMGFVDGMDVSMFEAVRTAEEGERLARMGQRTCQRLADLPVPTVAAIHGPCIGRGLELALACDARVATTARKTKLALPAVQLGVIPAAGATRRLPKLIGLSSALDLILTGKQVDASRAQELGLVDDVVAPGMLKTAAGELALSLVDKSGPNPLARLTGAITSLLSTEELQELVLEDNPFGRKVLFDTVKKKLLSGQRKHYPAPLEALDVIKRGSSRGDAAGFEAEAKTFGALVVSPVAKQLMRVWFAQAELTADSGVDDPTAVARRVDKVGLVGAGRMGTGVAYVTAGRAGIGVRLIDRNSELVGKGLARVRDMLSQRVARGQISARRRDDIMARISPASRVSGLGNAQVVIEAATEDLTLKQRLLHEVEEAGGTDVIFASNTSTISITKIAEASHHPETVVGMHYFVPAHKTPLLEVVRTDQTAPWVVATCVALGKRQGKTVIVVTDETGFYTARIRAPYINEAFQLLAEGIPGDAIDAALVDFGFPVGPLRLLDKVGFDVVQKTGILMGASFGARIEQAPGLDALIADERLGEKNRKGMYRYGSRHKGIDKTAYEALGVTPKGTMDADEIARRCVLQLVNEAAHCVGAGVVRRARDGDLGAIHGVGFPKFRGGPLRYVDAVGPAKVVEQLRAYEQTHGQRYRPAPMLVSLAEAGTLFYGPAGSAPASVTG